MYTGQFGIALAAKGVRPHVPLWALIGAAFGLDVASATLDVAGVAGPLMEWSESVAGGLVVAACAAGGYRVWRPRDRRGTAVLALTAALHIPADLVANAMPLWGGGPRVGAALYDHPLADFVVETALVVAGWMLYRRSLPAQERGIRRWSPWGMLALLVALQAMFSAHWPSFLW